MWERVLFIMASPDVVKHIDYAKTEALAADDPIILSFTNKAIQNVKSVLCDVYNNYE